MPNVCLTTKVEPAKAADLVRKLRAKAASTTFPEEAKLLTGKADKLARKYRVDERPPPRMRTWTHHDEGFQMYQRWRQRTPPPAPPRHVATVERDPATTVFDGEGSYKGS